MPTIADVYRALHTLEDEIVEKYAVCGGTAALFYDSETLRTYDIDVCVSLPQSGFLVNLSPIYEWAKARGYPDAGNSSDFFLVVLAFFVSLFAESRCNFIPTRP